MLRRCSDGATRRLDRILRAEIDEVAIEIKDVVISGAQRGGLGNISAMAPTCYTGGLKHGNNRWLTIRSIIEPNQTSVCYESLQSLNSEFVDTFVRDNTREENLVRVEAGNKDGNIVSVVRSFHETIVSDKERDHALLFIGSEVWAVLALACHTEWAILAIR